VVSQSCRAGQFCGGGGHQRRAGAIGHLRRPLGCAISTGGGWCARCAIPSGQLAWSRWLSALPWAWWLWGGEVEKALGPDELRAAVAMSL